MAETMEVVSEQADTVFVPNAEKKYHINAVLNARKTNVLIADIQW
jgi:hypothetical protein